MASHRWTNRHRSTVIFIMPIHRLFAAKHRPTHGTHVRMFIGVLNAKVFAQIETSIETPFANVALVFPFAVSSQMCFHDRLVAKGFATLWTWDSFGQVNSNYMIPEAGLIDVSFVTMITTKDVFSRAIGFFPANG